MKELNLESEDFHSCGSSETSELEHVCSKNLYIFMSRFEFLTSKTTLSVSTNESIQLVSSYVVEI
jgi:hypothetical protein